MTILNLPAKARLGILFILAFSVQAILYSCSKNMLEASDPELSTTSQSSAYQSRQNETTLPLERTVFVPCANGGNGEDVTLSGSLNVVSQVTFNKNRFTLTYHV